MDRNLYPKDWEQIALEQKEAANWQCQICGDKQGVIGSNGKKVVVAVAHLDQDRNNNDPDNLKVLCRSCHFKYDASFNVSRKKYGKLFYLEHQLKLW